MARFAEKRLKPDIEGLKVQRQILVSRKSMMDADQWTVIYNLVSERLKHLERLYEELQTIIKT